VKIALIHSKNPSKAIMFETIKLSTKAMKPRNKILGFLKTEDNEKCSKRLCQRKITKILNLRSFEFFLASYVLPVLILAPLL